MASGATGVNQVRAASEVNQLPVFPVLVEFWGRRSAVAEQRAALAMVNSSEPVISLLQHLASTSNGVTRSEPRTVERALCVSPPRPQRSGARRFTAARQMSRLEGSGVRNCGPQAHSVLAIAPRGAISPCSGCIQCLSSRFRASNGAKAQPLTDLAPSSAADL